MRITERNGRKKGKRRAQERTTVRGILEEGNGRNRRLSSQSLKRKGPKGNGSKGRMPKGKRPKGRRTKASTNGTAAGVKLGRTKGNEAEDQVSRNGKERMGNQPKEAVETEATKEAEDTKQKPAQGEFGKQRNGRARKLSSWIRKAESGRKKA